MSDIKEMEDKMRALRYEINRISGEMQVLATAIENQKNASFDIDKMAEEMLETLKSKPGKHFNEDHLLRMFNIDARQVAYRALDILELALDVHKVEVKYDEYSDNYETQYYFYTED